ncbi:MAG: hypothetical protein GYB67_08015 [Chloroflexi bacterium]|nr:hypothetical protein [Chloroflexota bacterium]
MTIDTPARAAPAARSQVRLHGLAAGFFGLLAFLTLYPIVLHSGTHVAGFDYFNYNWNFWWIRHALHTPGLDVYANDFVMFPNLSNYGYHALTAFWYPLWALLEPLTGTLHAVTVIIFLGAFLNGYLLFVLLRSESVHPGLALLGGAVLQVLPISRYFYYNTHLNLMDWFWLPAHLLLWQQVVAAIDGGRLRQAVGWALVQGIALWGLFLTDLQFPIFLAAVMVPYGLYTLWRSRWRVRLISAGIVAVGVAVALIWFAGPLPAILEFSGELVPGPVEDRPGVPFPGGLLSMADEWWSWARPSVGAFVTVAILLSTIVSVTPLRRRMPPDRWLWFGIMLPPLIFALGPTVQLGDQTIPMPYRWLYTITDGMFRMPWRLAPIFVIAGMIFAGKTWTPLLTGRAILPPRSARVFALAGAFLALAVSIRLYETAPLDPVPYPYTFYETMAAEPYDEYVVFEVPTGIGTGEVLFGDSRAIQLQFYGMTHTRRMVNGFISRAPIENFWYMVYDDPMISWLGQRRYLEPENVAAQLRERIFSWPIGYIVIHQNLIGRDGPTLQEIIGYLNQHDDLVCPFTVEGDAVVYRTRWHPDGCPPRTPPEVAPGEFVIDIGAPGDEVHLGWGWHYREDVFGVTLRWMGEYPQTRLYVDLPPADYTVTITAQAFHEPRTLQLIVNDQPLGTPATVSTDQLAEYTFDLPAEVIGDGDHSEVVFDYDDWRVPAELGLGGDQRRLALAVDWVRFAQQDSGQPTDGS